MAIIVRTMGIYVVNSENSMSLVHFERKHLCVVTEDVRSGDGRDANSLPDRCNKTPITSTRGAMFRFISGNVERRLPTRFEMMS